MNFLVTYMSETGNTRKVARAIYEELPDSKDICPLDAIESLNGYEVIFVGFPLHSFGPPEKVRQFIKTHAMHKKVALFVTHASSEDYREMPLWLKKCRRTARGTDFLGMFNCQGEMASDMIEFLKHSPDKRLRFFGAYGPLTKGLPSEDDLCRAREFARRIIGRTGRLLHPPSHSSRLTKL